VSARGLVLRTSGTVALAAAAHQALTGLRGVSGAEPPRDIVGDRNVDSEIRFYAVWYGVAGAAMHRAAGDREADRVLGPLVASGWAAAAVSRLLSRRAVGPPQPFVTVLTGLEAALAAALVATGCRRGKEPPA
jgi:hypothetical protein